MPRDALTLVLSGLTETIREMRAEAQETTDALLARRLMRYSGRLAGIIDVANAGIIARDREGSPSD